MADIPKNEFEANALINTSIKQIEPIEKKFYSTLDSIEKLGSEFDKKSNAYSDALSKFAGESKYEDDANKLVEQMEMDVLQEKLDGKKSVQSHSEVQNVINQVMDSVALDSQTDLDKAIIPKAPIEKKQSIDSSGFKSVNDSMSDLQNFLNQVAKSDNESLNQTSSSETQTKDTQNETSKQTVQQDFTFKNLQTNNPTPIQNIYPDINPDDSNSPLHETSSQFKNLFNEDVQKEQIQPNIELIYPTFENIELNNTTLNDTQEKVTPQTQFKEEIAPSAPSYEKVFDVQEPQTNPNNSEEKMEQQPRFTEDYSPKNNEDNNETGWFQKLGAKLDNGVQLMGSMVQEVIATGKDLFNGSQNTGQEVVDGVNEVVTEAENKIDAGTETVEKIANDSIKEANNTINAVFDNVNQTVNDLVNLPGNLIQAGLSMVSDGLKDIANGLNNIANTLDPQPQPNKAIIQQILIKNEPINDFKNFKNQIMDFKNQVGKINENNIQREIENAQPAAAVEIAKFPESAARATDKLDDTRQQRNTVFKDLLMDMKAQTTVARKSDNEEKQQEAAAPSMRISS